MIAAKPHLSPRPLPRLPARLPEGKQMTFIVGIKCPDGLVMCAESQESDGITKRNVVKLTRFVAHDESWSLAFGCSGSSAAIKNFTSKLEDALDLDSRYERAKVECAIEAGLSYMHLTYPSEELALLCSLWSVKPSDQRLYRSYPKSFCLSPEDEYACVGLDTSLAIMMMDAIIGDVRGVDDAIRLAVLTTSLMKDKCDGVGGPIRVLSHKRGDGAWTQHNDADIEALEKTLPLGAC